MEVSTIFNLYADKSELTVRRRETVASGSVNAHPVRFEFSPDWEGMEKIAVFRAGDETASVLLDASGECSVPWEVVRKPWTRLAAGVYGTRGGDVALPTVWADLGTVLAGAAPGAEAQPPAPDLWRQELERKQDKLTGLPGQTVGFDESGNLAAVAAYGVGHGLKLVQGDLTVETASDFSGDNTLPITAAAVQSAVGNIELLLKTI